jgi:hypothetical protein
VEEATVNPEIKYAWQQFLLDAFLEFKPEILQRKVSVAERAISQRLREKVDFQEYMALRDALIALQTLMPENGLEEHEKEAGETENIA